MTKNLAAKQDSGLDLAELGDLAAMLEMPSNDSARPKMFRRDYIHEDQNNPRTAGNPGFSDESIAELAASIEAAGGIKSPLSLRSDPDNPGHYIINHGHRRNRAAGVLGLAEVPAFLDEDFDDSDQVIENIQRENLTAREIADYIGGQLAKGRTQADVAKRLGRSTAFVSQHVKLLDLPEPVAAAFYSGNIQDVTLANELARAHKENPDAVEKALQQHGESMQGGLAAKPLTRRAVKSLRRPEASDRTRRATLASNAASDIGSAVAPSNDVSDWRDQLAAAVAARLQADVAISGDSADQPFRVVITVPSRESLEHVVARFGIANEPGNAFSS